MTIDLENLPPSLQFVYLAMTRSAIYFKEMDRDKDFFLAFCEEIWNSMEMTEIEKLKSILSEKMEKDIKTHLGDYIKNTYQKKRE